MNKHGNFKDSFNYSVLHRWLKKRIPKPECCQECGKREVKLDLCFKNHQAGFKTQQEYTRNLNDYVYLCRACHMILDGRSKNVKPINCICGKLLTINQYGRFHQGGGISCVN